MRPQLSAADYARSEGVRPNHLRGKLKNGFVIPQWIGWQDEFWYRRDTATGDEFIIVQAATGHAKLAFDHQQMAAAFSRASGIEVTAVSLPFEELAFSPDRTTIHFVVQGKEYECKQSPASCSSGKPLFPPPPVDVSFFSPDVPAGKADPNEGVLVSPNKKWGIFTRNNNLWLRDFTTGKDKDRPLTRYGVKHFGYGTYLDEFEDAALPRKRAIKAGHRLPPMASYWSPDSSTVIVHRGDERFVATSAGVHAQPASWLRR